LGDSKLLIANNTVFLVVWYLFLEGAYPAVRYTVIKREERVE